MSAKILVSGSTGLIGTALLSALRTSGYEVTSLVRGGASGKEQIGWDPARPLAPESVSGFDAVVHLAGESIVGRWTDAKKRRIRESRVQGTRNLAAALAAAPQRPHVPRDETARLAHALPELGDQRGLGRVGLGRLDVGRFDVGSNGLGWNGLDGTRPGRSGLLRCRSGERPRRRRCGRGAKARFLDRGGTAARRVRRPATSRPARDGHHQADDERDQNNGKDDP